MTAKSKEEKEGGSSSSSESEPVLGSKSTAAVNQETQSQPKSAESAESKFSWLKDLYTYTYTTPFDKMHADLVNPSFIPLAASRLYVYSTTDKLVHYSFVEEHLERVRGVVAMVRKKATAMSVARGSSVEANGSKGGRGAKGKREGTGMGMGRIVVRKESKGGHCEHARVDPMGYWEAVRALWFDDKAGE